MISLAVYLLVAGLAAWIVHPVERGNPFRLITRVRVWSSLILVAIAAVILLTAALDHGVGAVEMPGRILFIAIYLAGYAYLRWRWGRSERDWAAYLKQYPGQWKS